MKKQSAFKKWFRRLLMLVCLVVFCYSAVQLGIAFIASHEQKKIKQQVDLVVKLPENIEEKNEFSVDFNELKRINPDIIAYILIPNTNISYPIVYKENDNDYYLRRDLNGAYSPPGSIFMDGEAKPDFSDRHTFIYGHNMKDKTMFGDIASFFDQGFFDEHPYVYIFTPTKNYRLDVIAVERAPVNGVAYETVGLDTDSEMQVYINNLKQNANLYREVDVKASDSIVTLSTCGYYDIKNTRDILHLKVSEWKK